MGREGGGNKMAHQGKLERQIVFVYFSRVSFCFESSFYFAQLQQGEYGETTWETGFFFLSAWFSSTLFPRVALFSVVSLSGIIYHQEFFFSSSLYFDALHSLVVWMFPLLSVFSCLGDGEKG